MCMNTSQRFLESFITLLFPVIQIHDYSLLLPFFPFSKNLRRWRRGSVGKISSTGTFTTLSGTTKWQLDEFQNDVQSSYDNGLKDKTRDMHREFTFAMETQVVKIEKSHKEASKGTPRQVRLDGDDQDDRNELTLFLAGPSDS
uniref:Syntaxin 6 N-terminal domain-containing protein n=1 Tax=Brassica oleracea var. oleracea TaxID=109376 RepID=A0A0D3A959_BRAOL